MLVTWLAVTLMVVPSAPPPCSPAVAEPVRTSAYRPDLEALYAQGKTYLEFRDAARRRVKAWHEHYAQAEVPDALLARVKAVPRSWRLLVVAEHRCGDSANTLPYVARLADLAPMLDVRIIDSGVGLVLMETHRTPDGRPATPTIVLLNEQFREVGCWVERPAKLQTWFLAHEAKLEEDDLYEQKYAWYDEDRGRETLREVVEMIEAAAAGTPVCSG